MDLFWERDPEIVCSNLVTAESLGNSKISVRTRFEQKNFLVSFLKETTKRCPDPQRLPFKGSI